MNQQLFLNFFAFSYDHFKLALTLSDEGTYKLKAATYMKAVIFLNHMCKHIKIPTQVIHTKSQDS